MSNEVIKEAVKKHIRTKRIALASRLAFLLVLLVLQSGVWYFMWNILEPAFELMPRLSYWQSLAFIWLIYLVKIQGKVDD